MDCNTLFAEVLVNKSKLKPLSSKSSKALNASNASKPLKVVDSTANIPPKTPCLTLNDNYTSIDRDYSVNDDMTYHAIDRDYDGGYNKTDYIQIFAKTFTEIVEVNDTVFAHPNLFFNYLEAELPGLLNRFEKYCTGKND
jgi:hypothetical protein